MTFGWYYFRFWLSISQFFSGAIALYYISSMEVHYVKAALTSISVYSEAHFLVFMSGSTQPFYYERGTRVCASTIWREFVALALVTDLA